MFTFFCLWVFGVSVCARMGRAVGGWVGCMGGCLEGDDGFV